MDEFSVAILTLNKLWSNEIMFAIWLVPFFISVYAYFKTRSKRSILAVALFVPMLFYFGWAMTGLWQRHEVATAFNRTAQFCMVIFATFLTWDFLHEWNRPD